MTVTQRSIADRNVYGWALAARLHEIGIWRRVTADVVRGWEASEDAVDLVRFGVTELLSNAARHAGHEAPCWLEVRKVGVLLRVQVRDPSPVLPVVREPSWECESGRGLWVLRGMVRSLGWYRLPCGAGEGGGKIVWLWCDLAPCGAEEPGEGR